MLWPLLITLALVKLLAASLMLWMPFRTDSAVIATGDPPRSDADATDDDDGGSKVASDREPVSRPPHRPHPGPSRPRRPRRGPDEGSAVPGAPPRVRIGGGRSQRLRLR